MSLTRYSGCKINLLLNILGRRSDGYHELETVMVPVPLHDTLVFDEAPAGISLSCNRPDLPAQSGNLVWRAAETFFRASGIPSGIRIHLEKRVPLAAGLGGGSANAAVTLMALNDLFGHPLTQNALVASAVSLGSDVPFFLQSGPALATGRGELIQSLSPFPAFKDCWLVLVHPGFGISTAWAYSELARHPGALHGTPGRARSLLSVLTTQDAASIGSHLFNSLEAPALEKYPILQLYQENFRASGACGTLMSGSGSSTFAIYQSEALARSAAEHFRSCFGLNPFLATIPLSS